MQQLVLKGKIKKEEKFLEEKVVDITTIDRVRGLD